MFESSCVILESWLVYFLSPCGCGDIDFTLHLMPFRIYSAVLPKQNSHTCSLECSSAFENSNEKKEKITKFKSQNDHCG